MKSLKAKMLAYLVAPMIVTIATLNIVIANISFSSARTQAEDTLIKEVLSIALNIESENALAIRTANMLSLAQQVYLFGNREQSSAFAKATLDEFPEYTGAYFGYEPNVDGLDSQARQSDKGKVTDNSGRFLPYWYRSDGGLAVAPLEDMEDSLYYNGVKRLYEESNARQGIVTEPYVYQGTMIVEQTFPIIIGNEFKGIGGVDRSLEELENMLMSFKASTKKDLVLISREGRVISETINGVDLKTKPINQTVFAKEFSRLFKNKKNTSVFLTDNASSGQPYYFASAPVKSGSWMLVAMKPEEAVMGPIKSLFTKLGLFSAVCIFGLIAVSMWLVNTISKRVNNAADIAQKISLGDLTGIKLKKFKEDDEISIMQNSMHTVASSYIEIEKSCVAIAEGNFDVFVTERCSKDLVAKAINSLANRRREIEEMLESHSNRIQSSTQKQKIEIESVATSTNQMSTTITEVASLATQSADGASSATDTAMDTQKALSNSSNEVRLLAQEIGDVSTAISEVSKSCENIGKIVEVINMLAEQTNLLALNAAIEAARAGEHGRGFAVVADEVRTLASRTRSSTEEINQLISDLDSGVNKAVVMVEGSVDKAKTTITKSDEAVSSLAGIADEIKNVSDRMVQIATAVEEQSVACDEINQNIIVIQDEAVELAVFAKERK